MIRHNKLAKDGKLISIMSLQKEWLNVLKADWHFQKAKADIIAKDNNFLVFVESSIKFGTPEGAIDKNKITLYKDAAKGYLLQYPTEAEILFDIVSIIIAIEYIPNAF